MGDEGETCPAEEGGDLFQIHPNELVTTILKINLKIFSFDYS